MTGNNNMDEARRRAEARRQMVTEFQSLIDETKDIDDQCSARLNIRMIQLAV